MPSNIKNPYLNHLVLLFIIIFSAIILWTSDTSEYVNRVAILVFLEYVFLGYIFWRLKKSSLVLLLFVFPLFKIVYFWLYDPSWVNIGDFRVYIELLTEGFLQQGGITFQSIMAAQPKYHDFYYLTIINMYIPMKLYGISTNSVDAGLFLFFNDFILVALTAVTVNAFKGILQDKLLVVIVLFLLFSPTTLANTIYPDRHIFSLFALLWFARGIIRIRSKECKVDFYLLLAIIIIAINKPQLILALLLYIIFSNYKLFFRWYSFLLLPFLIGGFFYYDAHIHGIGDYLSNSRFSNAASTLSIKAVFGPLYILVIPIVKYVYDILSPFPWFNLTFNLSLSAGSYLTLFMVYMNAVFGLSIVISIVTYFSYLRTDSFYFKNFILYGLIISLSIIPADIGHSGYLAIYYTFFIPMFFMLGLRRTCRALFLSLLFLLILNFFLFFLY